ncbi:ThiS, thiamine-biosynthesis [hydrothermal vent metagenome]|uniref:ThiS, thiamine-biosynthesis n=1 Tax=hydrothermal vent metagenome TaxID=652676 RepID=A0A3B1E7B5_9ZZZZ
MQVIINGEINFFEKSITLKEIITNLKIENKIMATAVNMNIVKKDNWSSFIIEDNDKIEFLEFVGGG